MLAYQTEFVDPKMTSLSGESPAQGVTGQMEVTIQRGRDIQVTPCDGTESSDSWCYGKSRECCAKDSGLRKYRIAQHFGDPIPTELSSSSLSSSPFSLSPFPATSSSFSTAVPTTTRNSVPTSASQSTSSVPDAASESPPDTLSTGAKIGIGIGATFAALVLVALGALVARMVEMSNALSSKRPSRPVSSLSVPKWACETPVEMMSGPHSPLELPDNGSRSRTAQD
ncbi:hypothetical protein P171DRAFT_490452 [Karstenula rhodostoma CBS 690.94]|uniref:Mid2 domain-containing protein n=1 Tax=Karstenula rhodostoma CBS 690.94 TaxID=1392251 RepID=A0A9P4P5Y8_9PLEO|nr:hypothetical protein P171DRAFT_490452 [Karstenula rhodostoma CBS 690.94]